MKSSKFVGVALLLVLLGGSFQFAGAAPETSAAILSDDQIVTDIVAHFRSKVGRNYAFNSVFASSEGGNVILTGKVRDAYIKDRAFEAASEVKGVRSISNQIEVLPVSAFDDRIRLNVYRRLSNDSTLFHYFVGPDPAINIIVEGSRVTLVGVVNSQVDKIRAASRVRELPGVLSVENLLEVVRG